MSGLGEPPRIAIVGGGAIGCLFAALLNEAGHEVVVVSRRPSVVSTINSHGITVHDQTSDENREFHAHVQAISPADSESRRPFDVIFLVNKSMDAEWATELGGRLCSQNGIVVAIQNGLRSADIVEGIDRGVAGTTYQGAAYESDGRVRWTLLGHTMIAPRSELSDSAGRFVVAISTDSFPVDLVADRDAMVWEKMIGAISNSVSGALLEPVSRIVQSDSAWEIMEKARAEVFDVAEALGVNIDRARLETILATRPRTTRGTPGSTFQSLSGGRVTEIADISGAVVDAASRVNLLAPYNEMLALLVEARGELSQAGA